MQFHGSISKREGDPPLWNQSEFGQGLAVSCESGEDLLVPALARIEWG